MPNDSLAVNGGNVDTYTVAGDHRPVGVIGDSTGTQTATVSAAGALHVIDSEDISRTRTSAYAEAYSVTAADALVPVAVQRSGVALVAASTTALNVTAGKSFKLQAIVGSVTLLGTTVSTTRLRVRYNPSGVVAIGSPIAASWRTGGTTATANHVYPFDIQFPDGLIFLPGTGVGISAIATTAAMHSLDVTLVGYEF